MPKDFTAVKVLADSISPYGYRLTTFELRFPRFILAELNTHRMLSRNSASSRAIPTEDRIELAEREPFVPTFNARVKGMGVGEPLSAYKQHEAQMIWLDARDAAVKAARRLLHIDKSRANRLLEPFIWHTAIVSATDWENFFALRDHPAAQPEFRRLAELMKPPFSMSEPQKLSFGEWHLPMVGPSDTHQCWEDVTDPLFLPAVSAGRCARVSYDTHWREEPVNVSRARWLKLAPKGHWSPGEHPAQCDEYTGYIGNFQGWKQLRKFYPDEAIFRG